MGKTIMFVALGGMLGSVARFASVLLIARALPNSFPFGTFAVNLLGCFAMGAVAGWSEKYLLHENWRLFLTAGFCGGFTTFSAFAFESVELLQNRDYVTFSMYAAASFALCLLAAFAGLILGRG